MFISKFSSYYENITWNHNFFGLNNILFGKRNTYTKIYIVL